MTILQVKEHEKLYIGSRDPEHKVISHKQANALRKIEETLPRGVVRWGHKSVKFSQYCGVIMLGSDTVEILPKVYGKESDPGLSRKILIKMLYAARELTPITHGEAQIDLQKNQLLDVFIIYFCNVLYKQLHNGMIKIYVQNESNLPVVKGRMLVGDHFKHNIAHEERVYCLFDELQENNSYNQAIKATIRLLNHVARSNRVRQKLRELLFIFDEVQDIPVTSADVQKLPRNRIVNRYKDVFQLCEWFLSGISPDVVAGKNSAIALLFDMNRVFESLIASKMRKIIVMSGYKFHAQGPQRYLGEEQADNKKKLFLLRPDMTVLSQDRSVLLIGDTKWKVLDTSDRKYGVEQSDIYQMLAYGTRYHCKRLILVYPDHSEFDNNVPTILIKHGGYKVEVWKIDLCGLAGVGPSVESQIKTHMMKERFETNL